MSQLSHKDFTAASNFIDEKCALSAPRLRAALYPKRILPPSNYLNPRHYGACACAMYRLWMRPDANLVPHTVGMTVALALSKYKVPTYFIEPAFAEAVAQSNLPEEFYMKDIKWPMPAMLFVLPDAFVQKYFKYYLPFIAVARVFAGEYPRDFHPYPQTELEIEFGSPLVVESDRIMLHYPLFSTTSSPVDYTANYPLEAPISIIKGAAFIDARSFDEQLYEKQFDAHFSFPSSGPSGEADSKLQNDISTFAIKLMLALTARPEYIEPEQVARPENKSPKHYKEALYHPRMIGKRYRVLRPAAAAGEPTGRKMPMYWHPGCWMHIATGKRADFLPISSLPRTADGHVDWTNTPKEMLDRFWACHRFDWIESYLVNAPTDAQ